jgi:hypothetical protein
MPLFLVDAGSVKYTQRASCAPGVLSAGMIKSGQVTEKMLEEFYVCCQNLHD